MSKLPVEYYLNDDVLFLSRDLIGKWLFTYIDNVLCAGIIIETEAYRAPEDRASHAYGNRKTKRNAVMFECGGVSYVYRCYGIHNLFNIVTNEVDYPHAILIRAIQPVVGVEHMCLRRRKSVAAKTLAGGPATTTQALGIDLTHNGASLQGPDIWLEERGTDPTSAQISASPRVGVDYAGDDALLPWRFRFLGPIS